MRLIQCEQDRPVEIKPQLAQIVFVVLGKQQGNSVFQGLLC